MPDLSDRPPAQSRDARTFRIITALAVAGIAVVGVHWAAMAYGAAMHDAHCPLHGAAASGQ